MASEFNESDVSDNDYEEAQSSSGDEYEEEDDYRIGGNSVVPCGKQSYEHFWTSEAPRIPVDVVMHLARPFLGCKRTMVTDNFFTSSELGLNLLTQNTYLLGTMRKGRKGTPTDFIDEKLEIRAELSSTQFIKFYSNSSSTRK
uniref:PiggyBac transposable element-derived protein domain-containing protein n=1 Tax=Ditylenchus dipsaci TaxID=166011 RepID=A0A915EDV3_9BILA